MIKKLRNIEFYSTPDGAVMVKRLGEDVKELLPSDYEFVDAMMELINERYPDAIEALDKRYAKCRPNRRYFLFRMVERFCRCNFGRYDQTKLDIDEQGNLNLEEVDCPLHGTGDCPFFGVICRPKETIKLSPREFEVCRLVAHGMTNNEIARTLNISPLTVLRHRENARIKLNVKNTAQMIDMIKNLL